MLRRDVVGGGPNRELAGNSRLLIGDPPEPDLLDQSEDEPEDAGVEGADPDEIRVIALVSGKVREGVLLERMKKKGVTELVLLEDATGLPWPIGEPELETAVWVSGVSLDD